MFQLPDIQQYDSSWMPMLYHSVKCTIDSIIGLEIQYCCCCMAWIHGSNSKVCYVSVISDFCRLPVTLEERSCSATINSRKHWEMMKIYNTWMKEWIGRKFLWKKFSWWDFWRNFEFRITTKQISVIYNLFILGYIIKWQCNDICEVQLQEQRTSSFKSIFQSLTHKLDQVTVCASVQSKINEAFFAFRFA